MESHMTEAIAPLAERSAFEAAVSQHYDHLVRRLALVVGDHEEARDLAQSAYLRAYENRGRFSGGDARAWLFTIGIRLALNEARRRRRWRRWLDDHAPSNTWALETDPDLWAALNHLDRRQRTALVLTLVEGYTHSEVAEAMGVPTGTVASWLSRAKAAMRRALSEES
jgi:RNA polymerase sigma-70 factor, ECF subfamily